MNFNPNIPYNDLPALPPDVDLETRSVLKQAISSNRALAALVSDCKQLPNEGIFYNYLFLSEAKDSSEVENIITTNDDLFAAKATSRADIDSNSKEVLHYVDALWEGCKTMRETGLLTKRVFITAANTINGNDAGVRDIPVSLKNDRTGKVMYTPPEGRTVIMDKLDNLERYMNEESDVDPLIRMAVTHYQFEAIHPFFDGNGRTGRIINVLFLERWGLADHPVLFLSRYILDNRDDYYRGLRRVTTQGDWEKWIIYLLKGIEETSRFMSGKIADIAATRKEIEERIRSEAPRIYSKDLVEVIFEQPYCKIHHLVDAGIAKRVTASKHLRQLEDLGILSSFKVGRENLYVNKVLYEILKR